MSQTTTPTRPYVGLMPFHESDAAFFFGRDQERDVITSNLLASRLTLLYGDSGVGKSSVLRAGVAYQLRSLAQREIKRGGRRKSVVVVFNSWRDDPVQALLNKIHQEAKRTLPDQVFEPLPQMSFVEALREWSKRVQGQLLIILDQFEEYFLYHPNEEGEGTFAVEFPRAVNTPGLPVNFLVSYREDAHAKLDFFKASIPNLYDRYLRIGHLNYDAAYAAIEKPIHRYNELHSLDDANKYSVTEELITTVLSQVQAGERYFGEAGKGVIGTKESDNHDHWAVETPYLQLVMERLWETEVKNDSRVIQLDTLNRLGGSQHIVQTHLDNRLGELSGDEQKMAAGSFNYLVTPSGTKIAQTAHDLAQYAELSPEKEKQLDQMMEKLASGERRIFRSVPPPKNQRDAHRYEVFHDVLAQAILDWRRRYLARKQRRRLWAYIGVMMGALVLMAGITAFAVKQRNVAIKSENAARVSEAKANEAAALAIAEKRRADDAAKSAEMSAEKATTASKKNEELAASNKSLADKFAHAYQSEKSAKAEAVAQRKRAEELTAEAEKEQAKATAAALQLNAALEIVDRIDRSAPYSKAVIRLPRDLLGVQAAISRDGSRVVTAGAIQGEAQVWDVRDYKRPVNTLQVDDVIDMVDFSPDDPRVLFTVSHRSDRTGRATIWDISGVKPVKLDELSIEGGDRRSKLLTGASFTGDVFTVYGPDGAKSCGWNPVTRKLKPECTTLKSPDRNEISAAYLVSPDGKWLVHSRDQRDVYLYDPATGRQTSLAFPKLGDEPINELLVAMSHATISPDNRYLATFYIDKARVFDTRSGELIGEFRISEALISTITFSPNSRLLAQGGSDGTIRVWDIPTGRIISIFTGHSAPITDVEFSPDSEYVVSASSDRTARVWGVSGGNTVAELRGHVDELRSAFFNSEGNLVLTVGADSTVRVWDVSGRSSKPTVGVETTIKNGGIFDLDRGLPADAKAVDLSWHFSTSKVDERPLILATTLDLRPENNAQIADFPGIGAGSESGSTKRKFEDITVTELIGLKYSSVSKGGVFEEDDGNPLPAGTILGVRTSDGNYTKIQIVESGSSLKIRWVTFKNPNPAPSEEPRKPGREWSGRELSNRKIGPATLADFSADNTRIILVGVFDKIRVVETISGRPQLEFPSTGRPKLVRLSRDSRHVLMATTEGETRLISNGTIKTILRGGEGKINDAAFSNTGRLMATAGEDDQLRIYDVQRGTLVTGPLDHPKDVTTVAFSPDENVVVTGCDDFFVRVWDTVSGTRLHELSGPRGKIVKTTFSLDGTYLGALDEFGHLYLWRRSGDAWYVVRDDSLSISARDFAFDPAIKSWVIAGSDGQVQVVSLDSGLITGRLENLFPPGEKNVSVRFSHDGDLVSVRAGATAWVWNPSKNPSESHFLMHPVLPLSHTSRILSLRFSPDDKRILTVTEDGTLRTWELFTMK